MKMLLRLVAWLGAKAQEKLVRWEREEALRTALPSGTFVWINKCPCGQDHRGIWEIERYDVEANDYRIVHADGRSDYAKRDVMEIVPVKRVFTCLNQ